MEYLSQFEELFKDIASPTERGMNKIHSSLNDILNTHFFDNIKENDNILSVRIRFFDVPGVLQVVDYTKKNHEVNWLRRQSTYEESSSASFFYPSFLTIRKDDMGNPKLWDDIPIILIVYSTLAEPEHVFIPKNASDDQKVKFFNKNGTHYQLVQINKKKDAKPEFSADFSLFKEYIINFFNRNDLSNLNTNIQTNFKDSTIPKIKDLMKEMPEIKSLMKRRKGKILYAYFIPIIYSGKMVAHMTITASYGNGEIISLKDIERGRKRVGFISYLFSAAIAQSNQEESRPLPYFKTQSIKLWWPHGVNIEDPKNKDKILEYLNNLPISDDYGINNVLKAGYDALVENVLLPLGDPAIATTILEQILLPLLKALFKGDIKLQTSLEDLLKAALDSQGNLKNIPQYRQHFIHSFHVFLTGLRLFCSKGVNLDRLLEEITIKGSEGENIKTIQIDLLKAWFIAAIFHDISYVFANVENWVNEAVNKIVFTERDNTYKNNQVWVRHQISNLFRVKNYHSSFQKLITIIQSFSPEKVEKDDGNNAPQEIIPEHLFGKTLGDLEKENKKADHGVLSAILLLSLTQKYWNEPWLLLAADAIACHSSLWKYDKKKEDHCPVYFDNIRGGNWGKNILRDLLIISDTIQQWGRSESDEAQRLFFIQLDEWNEDDSKIRIKILYELLPDKKKNLKKPVTEEDDKNLVEAFAENWGIIKKEKSTIERNICCPNISIALRLKINSSDHELLSRIKNDAKTDFDQNIHYDIEMS